MSGKRRHGARIALLVLFGLSLSAPVARSQTIVRSVVGSGWGWDPIIKPGFAWHLLGTVGQGEAGESIGGPDGWYIGSGFWTPWEVRIGTGVDEPSSLGPRNRLEQNIPNPFNPTTTISFSLIERSMVELTVMDVRGRVLEVLLREERDAGVHQIEYRPTDLPSGVYFYRLRAGNFVQTRRFVLLK
jgi:hypothetical protein